MPHNHLLINHLPIFATLFGLILIWVGLLLNNSTLRITSLITLLIGGFSFLPTNFTGERAYEVVEHLEGVDKKSQRIMHEHEEAAEFATPFGIAMAVLALAGIVLEMRTAKTAYNYAKITSGITGVLAIVVMVLLAGVANSGGEIRHTEIRKDFKNPPTNKAKKEDND